MGYVYLCLTVIAEVIAFMMIVAGVAVINLFSKVTVH